MTSILASQYEGGYGVNPIDSIIAFDVNDLLEGGDELIINELAPGNTEGDEPVTIEPTENGEAERTE